MRRDGPALVLSATDLSNFLGCRHRTALEMEAVAGIRHKPHFDDPLLELLFQRGLDHEKAYVESLRAAGRSVTDLSQIERRDAQIDATLAAMRDGADVIVQGALRDGQWFGKPDVLLRTAKPSRLGAWSYEIADTKLARDTRAGAILQLSLYSRMLGVAQGLAPEHFSVVTPDIDQPVHRFRVDDYAAYVRLVQNQLASTVLNSPSDIAAANYPEPVDHCHICPWSGECKAKRHADDHLSLAAGITRAQRRELQAHGTETLTDLGRLLLPIPFKPDRGSVESFVRVREQARLQVESRGKTPPLHELRDIVEGEGLSRLPAPSPGDLFLDLEGDNLSVDGGREYLFGVVSRGENGAPEYRGYWAADASAERAAFEQVMDLISSAVADPDMHVYHYAPYETTAFKRLMGRYATREDALDGMLREGRFVDLYAVVRQGLRAGIERYSIKNLEPLYGFAREVPLPEAGPALRDFEYALAIGAVDTLPPKVRRTVEGYNRDDCVSTLRLYEWLEVVRQDAI
ncbi:MAG: TM0106 family RecB-like putative nuclease, partial [Gemmatimonadaceae bacterium]